MSEQRDGRWMDKFGACKVCDGEIPHGHTNDCDIYKLEQQLTLVKGQLASTQDMLKKGYAAIPSMTVAGMPDLKDLIGMVVNELNNVQAENERLHKQLAIFGRREYTTASEVVSANNDAQRWKLFAEELQQQLSSIEKQVLELRNVLNELHEHMYEPELPLEEELRRCQKIRDKVEAVISLTSPELEKKWVSRDILQTLYRAADEGMNLSCDSEVRKQFRDAMEAARKELG